MIKNTQQIRVTASTVAERLKQISVLDFQMTRKVQEFRNNGEEGEKSQKCSIKPTYVQ